MTASFPFELSRLDFDAGAGFVTVVTQDAHSGCVLMTARADREAVRRTLATGEMHYHSRTRGLWHKGATSGNRQRVVSLSVDCDGDALLARVIPVGPACHTGGYSCFASPDAASGGKPPGALAVLAVLDEIIAARAERVVDSEGTVGRASSSHTERLLRDRNLRLKKLGEEAAELVVACADGDASQARTEGADLLYHMLVALRSIGVSLADLAGILEQRQRARTAP